jgi:hypothetical protein
MAGLAGMKFSVVTPLDERDPFVVHCAKCGHEWAPTYLPVQIDVAAKALKKPCPACNSKEVKIGKLIRPTETGRADQWIRNGDTGTSSETIWSVLSGHPVKSYGIPYDPADFGRCYRLLTVMPEWRGRLHLVAAKFPKWEPLVAAWDELTALYEAEVPNHKGVAPKLYARIQELNGDK